MRRPLASALAVALIAAWLKASAWADTITLGFIEFPHSVHVLRSHEMVAQFLRAGVTRSLIQTASGPVGYRLALSDSLSVSADRRVWSFRIKNGENFHNGQPVSADDAAYSLELCRASGKLPDIASISSRRHEVSPGVIQNWVDVEIDAGAENGSEENTVREDGLKLPREPFPLPLAQCPVIERLSAELFGQYFGVGSNFVGSGGYFIADFKAGREITLNKFNQISREGASQIVLRGFKDPRHGLTALRSGTIDALFQPSAEVIEKAQKDKTLAVADCRSDKLVLRRGFNLNCKESLSLSKLGFIE